MDEEYAAPVDEPRQWVHLESESPPVADDSASSRLVGMRVLVLVAVVALGAGIGIGAFVTDGRRSGDAIEETAPADSPADAARVRHLVPQWLPHGLTLQSADDGYGSEPSCQPSAIGGAAPASAVVGAIPVGPGVCARPTSVLRYVSAPLPGAITLTLVQGEAADIRSPAPTSSTNVRGRQGLLYRSGESVWLAWAEDAETTFFVTSSGVSVDDVLRIAESLAVVDAEEWARLRATSPLAAAVENGPPFRTEVVACLRNEGLEVPDVTTGPTSVVATQQHPPVAAQAAWQACRDMYARSNGMPINQLSQILAVPDCMAAQGWLVVVMSGPPADGAAYSAAMQKCQPAPPGVIELIRCLRTEGLDVPEPAPGAPVVSAPRQYPPSSAQAAWQACRDDYIKTSGIPGSALLLYDCMAARGWIVAISSGPPAAYGSASQSCSQRN